MIFPKISAEKIKGCTFTFLGVLILLGVITLRLKFDGVPEVKGADAAAGSFSAVRAMEYVRAIAEKPHPAGSEQNRVVRDYLLKTLRNLGLDPIIHKSFSVYSLHPRFHRSGGVENIAAKIDGTVGENAVLVLTHYDSVNTGPGASDDASAVAAMLETIRALKSYKKPINDIIFLFSDAEEILLLGANAFAREHPWMKNVKVVLNFEARGTSGPSILFETGPGSGKILNEFLDSAPFPIGNSFAGAIYDLIPNETDFSVFKKMGYEGLNFAFIEDVTHYHSMLDNISNVDLRSLQHHGEHMLAAAGHFGSSNLSNLKGNDRVFFQLIENITPNYSETVSFAISILVLVLYIALLIFGLKKGKLKIGKVSISSGLLFLSLLIIPAIIFLLWQVIKIMHPGYDSMVMGDTYNSLWYRVAFSALTAGFFAAVYQKISKRIDVKNILSGGIFLLLLLIIIFMIFIPGGSYLFQWTLVILAPAFILILMGKEESSGYPWIILGLSALIILFLSYVIFLLYVSLTLRLVFAASMFMVIFLMALIPLIDCMTRFGGRAIIIILLFISIVSIIGGSITSGFDTEKKRPNSVVYLLNQEEGKARWVTCDSVLDEWSSQFFVEGVERRSIPDFFPLQEKCILSFQKMLTAKAAVMQPVPPGPVARVISDRKGDKRELIISINSMRKAEKMMIYIRKFSSITGIMLNGKKVEIADSGVKRLSHKLLYSTLDDMEYITLMCEPIPDEGLTVSISLDGTDPVELHLVDISWGVPEVTGFSVKPRKSHMMPSPNFFLKDSFMMSRKYKF